YGLVIPDENKTLREGAVRPWQSESYKECQEDLEKHAKKRGVSLDRPWRELTREERHWVIEGEGPWDKGHWYGIRRFFDWLETRAYKMHVRVLLSRYRAYTPCDACGGARLRTYGLLWRVGSEELATQTLAGRPRFRPQGVSWSAQTLEAMPGLCLHDLMLLPVERVVAFFRALQLPAPLDKATDLLLAELRSRTGFLSDVGLAYLTLDRQSRTLSGGEVQRINLTTALGTSLVNTLFVLDEPSIGLHPRDMQRVIAVMKRLRDAGNSLLVVEHDPQIMLEADRIIDMGPGAGERGGQIVFNGTPAKLRQNRASLTADYLSGRRTLPVFTDAPRRSAAQAPGEVVAEARTNRWLEIRGIRHHNVKGIDVRIPLKRLVCITGVSGSGKSTVVEDVLYPALLKYKGRPSEAPGEFDSLRGAELIDDVVMVDQTPIGRTTRSNPASYVGAFDVIRELYSLEPTAVERRYTAGTFSFNSGNGRCPTCSGNGFEHVEMQFLSDVYLRCPDCNGSRYRDEVLEVRREGSDGRRAHIAEVLDMTVTEALAFFGESRELATRLKPLADVGLEYVKLGQPVPTLSGGEAQRLKLAGHLAEAAAKATTASANGKLFLFDEPTTGLHFEDVAKLLRAFAKLRAAGHSLLVIEHNLDVMRACDWIIDLGPEGGDAGGNIVFAGTPTALRAHKESHTGRALVDYEHSLATAFAAPAAQVAEAPGPWERAANEAADQIVIHNAREHNLKDVDVRIPRDRFTVITGVSGSGKSTLAFDILFNEGQRRYLESLNAYARSLVQPAGRPDVDAIHGIPPTVAIEQRTSRGGRKSTVATMTEVYHFLRLLFVRLGTQHCPACGAAVTPQSFEAIAAQVLRDFRGQHVGLLAPLIVSRKGLYSDLAKWAANRGCSHLRVDAEFVPTAPWPRLDRFREHTIEMPIGDLVIGPQNEGRLRELLGRALEYGHGQAHVVWPLERLEQALGRGG
ncbi:MAG TPA: hypothetical protein VLV29_01510, partial [Steroidobacteraceae bacterium]|nr:hypothetical protein [Steroidobacteraceae bacterium]